MKSRFDYFLIWGHGLQHSEEILRMIRQRPDFEIVKVKRHRPRRIDDFVEELYSIDYAPWKHLVEKTRYLMETPPDLMTIFVRNLQPDEQLFGKGAFRHVQCVKMKAFKEDLRNRFNPILDGKRTEDHVIHASDCEAQTDHLLKMLGYRSGLMALKRVPNPVIPAPAHLGAFDSFRIVRLRTSDLRCTILEGSPESYTKSLRPVEETPHYGFVAGDPGPYQRYVSTFGGWKLADDHWPEAFANLARSFAYLAKPHEADYILVKRTSDGSFAVIDGVHRAAILKHQKKESCLVAVVS